jgi:hypothetical protein
VKEKQLNFMYDIGTGLLFLALILQELGDRNELSNDKRRKENKWV